VRQKNLPNPDVKYPQLGLTASVAYARKICSLPVFDPAKVAQAIDRLKHKKAG